MQNIPLLSRQFVKLFNCLISYLVIGEQLRCAREVERFSFGPPECVKSAKEDHKTFRWGGHQNFHDHPHLLQGG